MARLTFEVKDGSFPRLATPLKMHGRDPLGNTLAVTRRYLEYNGRPLLPVMGEFHFTRYPADYWEESLLKMKACGVDVVSTYVFWIHHEEARGKFRWDGQRDLRRFVELCRETGLWCFLRLGPFAHGECRNGGIPDWLWGKEYARSDDERFLVPTRRLFGEIFAQVRGLLFRDGGPVIGLQLENEFQGGKEGIPYISALKRLAGGVGFDLPIWTVTGWGERATIPENEVIPVFGGYPAAPWTMHVEPLDVRHSGVYFFLPGRNPDLGAADSLPVGPDDKFEAYPKFTCEVGAGVQSTYHRRPSVGTWDVLAIATTMLGSGVNLLGYYMFHGGTNPEGELGPMNETLGRPSILEYPAYSYDFQAPLGEFGTPRESYHEYRLLHLFVHEVASKLAPTDVDFPKPFPRNASDCETPRAALRLGPEGGFLFLNNHDRHNRGMRDLEGLSLVVRSPSWEQCVPSLPVTIPGGTCAIWPLNLEVGSMEVVHSTCQLVTTLNLGRGMGGRAVVAFFRETPGVPAEFVVRVRDGTKLETPPGCSTGLGAPGTSDGLWTIHEVRGFPLGVGAPALSTTSTPGGRTTVYVLDQREARLLWKGQLAGRERVVFTAANAYFRGGSLVLYGRDPGAFGFTVAPPPPGTPTGAGVNEIGRGEYFATYEVRVEAADSPIPQWEVATSSAGVARECRFSRKWFEGVNDLFLRVLYVGNRVRFSIDGKVVWDDYYRGVPAEIGLKRWRELLDDVDVRVEVTPLERDDDIYFDVPPEFPPGVDSTCAIRGIEIIPEYAAEIGFLEE
ncbi:MAG: beta-galactosidase [Promethearchaeota archaeon]